MALKDFLSLADSKLRETFHLKPHDPAKARGPVLKGIERTHNQFSSATPVKGRKWFKISNGVVELTLPFEVNGSNVLHFPSERFADALAHLKDSVTKGELDKEIEAGTTATPATKAPRAARASGGGGKGWSEERKAKFAATIAARKASAK